MRTVVVPAVALLLVLLPPGPVVAAQTGGNEFLDMDLAQLMNITVTSVAKKEQRLSDAPAAVFVITQEDIRRSGVTTVPAASRTAGVTICPRPRLPWKASGTTVNTKMHKRPEYRMALKVSVRGLRNSRV